MVLQRRRGTLSLASGILVDCLQLPIWQLFFLLGLTEDDLCIMEKVCLRYYYKMARRKIEKGGDVC